MIAPRHGEDGTTRPQAGEQPGRQCLLPVVLGWPTPAETIDEDQLLELVGPDKVLDHGDVTGGEAAVRGEEIATDRDLPERVEVNPA
ncbi:MAG: hypothetical protein MSC30_07375 [Gaiellaceae bacterium MAG52_C11]|nr:hypothetical protein [Candidatus Gaiellasilicea maunaloa]